ncbi:MAG: Protein-tyrosine-phosphatase [Solirubrobacterales bacterium]|nr:Protein-tyrosine-phosphatase [Solirubrobacterales bacterium]
MIDLHCHILPGIDDGPRTMEDTLELARASIAAGTATIVATPHVSWDYPDNTSQLIAQKVDEVNAVLRDQRLDLEVRPGAEVALTRALDLSDAELSALTLGGGPWLLLECPLSPVAVGVEEAVQALRRRGHEQLVLAHPERVPAFQRDPELLARLVDSGLLTSVTAGAFTGDFGKDVQRFARKLLADGLVHDVASDAHSTTRRPPAVGPPLQEAGLDANQVDHLARAVPLAILQGVALPAAPAMPEPRRGFLSRLRSR